MPWQETNAVNERIRLIAAHQQGLYSMTELCLRRGITSGRRSRSYPGSGRRAAWGGVRRRRGNFAGSVPSPLPAPRDYS